VRPHTFVRLEYDTSLVKKVPGYDSLFTIKTGVGFQYWEDSHHHDTLVCNANTDTQQVYRLAFKIVPGRSNIPVQSYGQNILTAGVSALYYSLLHPFFFNAHGAFGLVASAENVLIGISLLIIIYGFIYRRREVLLPLIFVVFALLECMLIGFTSPNAGAIFRYRAPAVIFLLLAALYFLSTYKKEPAQNK
jgi:hypothetical protein